MPGNPYYNQDFFSFLWIFIQRLVGFATGSIDLQNLTADEIQIAVLSCVAMSSGLLGIFLVLRRMTMLANAISHTILLGIVIAFLLSVHSHSHEAVHQLGTLDIQAMLIAAIITGLATAFLTQFLTTTLGLQEDASVGIVFHTLFALGIVLVTLFTRNTHIGIEAIMGNADALQPSDIRLVLTILGLNVALMLLFFKELKVTTFDPQLAQALGVSTLVFNYLLMLQVSMTSIGAFRAVGVIMVLAFMTGPPLTALLFSAHLGTCLVLAAIVGVGCSLIGVALSRHILSVYGIPLSTGGIVVCVITLVFFLALFFSPNKGIVIQWWRRQRENKLPPSQET